MNEGMTKNLRFILRYGIWSELANIFRILNELLLMLVWFVTLSEEMVKWGESFLWLAAINLGSYILVRFLHSLKWKISIERLLFTGWILVTIFLGIRFMLMPHISMNFEQFLSQIFTEEVTSETTFGFWVLLFNMIAMLRGVQLTRYPVSTRDMTESFRWSLVIFAIFALIFRHFQVSIFLPTFFIFLLSSLAGLSMARIADLSENNDGRLPGFNFQWAIGIGGAALGVILISMLFSVIINLDVAKLIGKGLIFLLQLLSGALVIVSSPIIWLVITVFQFLLKLISPNLENAMEELNLQTGEQILGDLQENTANAPQVDPLLFVMIGVIVVFIVIAIIQFKKQTWKRDLRGEEDISIADSLPKKSNPLKNLFPSRMKSGRRSNAKSLFAAARIRFTYSQLMDLCEKLGKARPRSVTPLEFLPRMDDLFPDNHTDLETITNAYIKIRYGELPETDRDVEVVLEAWRKVSEIGKEHLEVNKKSFRRIKR